MVPDPCPNDGLYRLLHLLVQRLSLERIKVGSNAGGQDQSAKRHPILVRLASALVV